MKDKYGEENELSEVGNEEEEEGGIIDHGGTKKHVDKIRDKIKRKRGEVDGDGNGKRTKRERDEDESWYDSTYEGDVVEEPSEECDSEYYNKIVDYAKSLAIPPD